MTGRVVGLREVVVGEISVHSLHQETEQEMEQERYLPDPVQ